MSAQPPVESRVLAHLQALALPFALRAHDVATSAEEIARLRGTPLDIGGKAIVMKLDRLGPERRPGFAILAVRGSDAVDNRAFRKHLGVRRYRFATRDELDALTGLQPGCVPPFGRPIFDLPLFVDAGLAANQQIAFTPGTHERSVLMATADWLTAARPDDSWPFARPGR